MDKLCILLLGILSVKAYPTTNAANGGLPTFGQIKAPYEMVEVNQLRAVEPGVYSSPYVVASQIVEESGAKNARATLVRFATSGASGSLSDCRLALNFLPGRFSEVHIGKPGQTPVDLNIYMVDINISGSPSYSELDPISEPWGVSVAPGLHMPGDSELNGKLANGSANYLIEIANSVDVQAGVSWRNEIAEDAQDTTGSFGIFLLCK